MDGGETVVFVAVAFGLRVMWQGLRRYVRQAHEAPARPATIPYVPEERPELPRGFAEVLPSLVTSATDEPPALLPSAPEETAWDEEDRNERWPRVIWVNHERFEQIPWDQRAASPKDIAIWRCRRAAETFVEDEPELTAALLERVEAWRGAPGLRAGQQGWAVYRQLGRLKAAAGRPLPHGVEAAVLEALSARFPAVEDPLATD